MASGLRPMRPSAATGSSQTTVTLVVVVVLVVGLLAAAIVSSLAGDDGKDSGSPPAATSSPSGSPSSPSPSASSAAPSVSSPATSSPTKKATATATSNAKTAAPSGTKHVAGTYTGHGSGVLKIKKPGNTTGRVLVVATHAGAGSFGVLALDATLHETDILINVAGRYRGTTLLDGQGTQTQNLRIRARGPWTLTIKPVSAARSVSARAKGTGDDVLSYTGVKGLATFDCRGGLNFIVSFFGSKSNAVLVNEVGPYHGQVGIQNGPALIAVRANAAWTMKVAA